MYAVIYLDNERRIKVYSEGGFEQECLINFKDFSDWYLVNDNDWPDLPDVLNKFGNLLLNAENNFKVIEDENYRQQLTDKFGAAVIYEAESYYETDFGKEFWRDLTKEEQLDYIYRARNSLNSQQK